MKRDATEKYEEIRKHILNNQDLIEFLRSEIPGFYDCIYLLDYIPEQAEDIFVYVINGNKVVKLEVSRPFCRLGMKIISDIYLTEYLKNKKISKTTRRELNAIIELSKRIMAKGS